MISQGMTNDETRTSAAVEESVTTVSQGTKSVAVDETVTTALQGSGFTTR